MHQKGEVSIFFPVLRPGPVCFPYFPRPVALVQPCVRFCGVVSCSNPAMRVRVRACALSAIRVVVLAVRWHLALWRFETPKLAPNGAHPFTRSLLTISSSPRGAPRALFGKFKAGVVYGMRRQRRPLLSRLACPIEFVFHFNGPGSPMNAMTELRR